MASPSPPCLYSSCSEHLRTPVPAIGRQLANGPSFQTSPPARHRFQRLRPLSPDEWLRKQFNVIRAMAGVGRGRGPRSNATAAPSGRTAQPRRSNSRSAAAGPRCPSGRPARADQAMRRRMLAQPTPRRLLRRRSIRHGAPTIANRGKSQPASFGRWVRLRHAPLRCLRVGLSVAGI